MTREEAIQVLTDIKRIRSDEIAKAIDMALEALSQPIVAKHFDIQSGYIYCSPQIAENVKIVVRCKDCRYYSNNHLCEQLSRFGNIEPLADFYCGFGERREP